MREVKLRLIVGPALTEDLYVADTPTPAPGTSSTPPAAPASAATPAAVAALYPSTSPKTDPPAEPAKPADAPVVTEPPKAEATPDEPVKAEPAKTDPPAEPAKAEPLFTLPEDFKPPATAVTKFTTAISKAMVDGKLSLTPQQVVDMYVEQARDANAAWQAQIEQTDAANKAACQQRFSPQQLKAAESAVGWFSSFEPAFHDFSKRQLNDPVFVNAMRLIGESLQEDEFLPASPPGPTKRSPAEIMGYTKKQ